MLFTVFLFSLLLLPFLPMLSFCVAVFTGCRFYLLPFFPLLFLPLPLLPLPILPVPFLPFTLRYYVDVHWPIGAARVGIQTVCNSVTISLVPE